MITIATADEFFTLHLLRSTWQTRSEQDRAAALKMAERDVSGELGGIEAVETDILMMEAVCEQAVYLLAFPEAINPKGAHLESESVDGVGSRTYRNGSNPAIGPRAARLIELIRGSGARNGTVRLSRG